MAARSVRRPGRWGRPLSLELLEDRTPPVGLLASVGGLLGSAALAAAQQQRHYPPPYVCYSEADH